MTRVNAMRACEEGEEAFRAGLLPWDCPYLPTDATQDFLRYYYLAGWWMAARPDVEGARTMHFARTFRDWGSNRGRPPG